jgi:hypothetical protein
MRDEIKNSWEARQRNAIERLVAAWEKYAEIDDRDDPDP